MLEKYLVLGVIIHSLVSYMDHPAWRWVAHNSRAKTGAKMNYSKVEGESLAILSGIMSNKMYIPVWD